MLIELNESDIALLDAVHISPRVSFEELGRVLDMSAVTASRRWGRLVAEGRAWVSSAPGPRAVRFGALVEVECDPTRTREVAASLAALPQVFSVHITTGRMNVYALLATAVPEDGARLLIDVIPACPGIRSMRAATVVEMFSGTHWRLGAITSAQAQQVANYPLTQTHCHEIDELDRALYFALQLDGRLGVGDLAGAVGCSVATVRRRLDSLARSGLMTFRADFARQEGGWTTYVLMTLSVPLVDGVGAVGRALVSWQEVRVCASLIGDAANLVVALQLHRVGEMETIARRLNAQFPGVSVVSTRTVLAAVKSFGRLIGPDGRAVDVVPVDPWLPVP